MKKLYPSSSAFMLGDVVITEYDSGCLRKILLTSKGVKGPFPAIYAKLGAVHESTHKAEISRDERILNFQDEVVIRQPVPGNEDVQYSGRADFVCNYVSEKQGTGLGIKTYEAIHETKGTISKNTRLQVIRKKVPKVNQLAQLVSYMIIRETPRGKLVCGYYEENEEGELVQTEQHTFMVFINDAGEIIVDGKPSGYCVSDQIAHRQAAAEVLNTDTVGGRPDKWDDKYKGPCGFCMHKETCNRFDQGNFNSTDEFVESARADVEIANINKKDDPVPNKLKLKKPKKQAKKGESNGNA